MNEVTQLRDEVVAFDPLDKRGLLARVDALIAAVEDERDAKWLHEFEDGLMDGELEVDHWIRISNLGYGSDGKGGWRKID